MKEEYIYDYFEIKTNVIIKFKKLDIHLLQQLCFRVCMINGCVCEFDCFSDRGTRSMIDLNRLL